MHRIGVALAAAVVCCAPVFAAMGVEDARHLLGRTGFGAAPAEIAAFARLSREAAVERLLAPVAAMPGTQPPGLDYLPPRRFRDGSDEDKRAMQRDQLRKVVEMKGWWVGEMLAAGPAEALRERMTLFWHNHFVSGAQKVKSSKLLLDQNQLLRRHAIGNFGQLLHAVSRDPAMLVYLDAATNRRGQPNENFAREVMELFTLGEGHYGEQDIREAARAFTGWSIEPDTGAYKWRPFAHDDGEKIVLGRRGNFDGAAVLDILLARPETAQLVSAKLWREFVAPQVDAREAGRIAGVLRSANYELRPALRALLLSPAFWAPANRGALVKSPVDLVVGTLRSLGVDVPDPLPFGLALRQLGQDIFDPPNVKGWPGGDAWINATTLLARKQFAERLMRADNRPARGRPRDEPGETMTMAALDDRARIQAALDGVRVDAAGWLAAVAAAGLTPESVLLAMAPVNASSSGSGLAGERVKALLLDPAYQVK